MKGQNQVDIETTITYRDGRKSVMRLPIYIETIQVRTHGRNYQGYHKKNREQRYSYG